MSRWIHRTGIILVLLAAAWLRLYRLDEVPPGWRDDEVVETTVHAALAAAGLHLYFPQAEGHEPLYHYLSAGWIGLLGASLFSVRLLSAFLGVLSVAALHRLGRRLFGSPVALLAAAGLALSFWGLMYSRFKLRHVSEVFFMLLTFSIFLWLARDAPPRANHRKHLLAALAGVALAATLYTYFAARVVPVILLAWALYLWLFHRPAFRVRWRAMALAGGVAVVLTLPLAIAIALAPGGEERLGVVGQPLLALLAGDPRPVLRNTLETIGMFAFTGDPEYLYNIPGRPVFGWGGALLFLAGLLVCLRRWRDPRYAFLLLWLLGGLAPAFLSTPSASLGHTIAAQPVVFLLPVVGIAVITETFRRRGPRSEAGWAKGVRGLGWMVALLYLALLAARDLPDYFIRWPALPEVRYLYRADLHAAAPALRALAPGSDLALTSRLLHPADALALSLETSGLSLRPRVFSPERAWLFPERDVPVLLRAGAEPAAFGPALDGLPVSLGSTRLPDLAAPAVPLAAPFANGWEFTGWRMERVPGQTSALRLLTYWRVGEGYTPPPPRPVEVLAGMPLPLKFFTHLLGADGTVVAGEDRLDVDPATLRPGDTFLQLFIVPMPADLAPGAYPLQLGMYDPATGARVPLASGEEALRLTTLELP